MSPRVPAVVELINTLPTASAVFDGEMRYLAANDRWRQDYRVGETKLEGRSHYDVFPEVSDAWRQIHRRCLGGTTERTQGERFVHADGTVDYVDCELFPWRDASGAIGGVIAHSEVVTEQARMHRLLQEERAFHQALFDKSPVGMNLCTLDGLWLESNQAFLDIIGYSHQEADGGLTYWQLTPEEYAAEEQVQLASLERIGRYGPYEKEFIRKNGSRVPVRLNGFIIEREGQKYIWSLIEDLTSQRALESTVERERMKAHHSARLASIGEMAAGVAHEINNPLQIIDASAYVIQLALKEGEAPPSDALDDIRLATKRAARIVDGLRRFARDDEPVIGSHAIDELVDESLALVAARIRNHGVSLHAPQRIGRFVRCNPFEVTQVLVNLLNNAFDAVRETHGTVRISLCSKESKGGDDRDRVVLRIIDNGPGVSDQLVDRLFEPFATTKVSGMGLGLSISRAIMESFGGSLGYARVGEESHFTATFVGSEEPRDAR